MLPLVGCSDSAMLETDRSVRTHKGINQQRQERHRYLSTDQPVMRNRSLLSRSRVHRAIEAARRVGGGLIVAALNVGSLRSGAGAPTDAGRQRPAGREGDRRAEQGGTPLRGPARLVEGRAAGTARAAPNFG